MLGDLSASENAQGLVNRWEGFSRMLLIGMRWPGGQRGVESVLAMNLNWPVE